MATFIVDTESEFTNFNGPLTLRQAVQLANQSAGPDTITFAANVSFIRLTQGELLVTDTLTVLGGEAGVTISGDAFGDDIADADNITNVLASGNDRLDDNSRIFNVTGFNNDLTLEDLTLTGGRAIDGGAIISESDVTATRSLLAGNSVNGASGNGGAILAEGDVTLVETFVSDNRASGSNAFGGGVASFGDVALTDSEISGNIATAIGGGVFGTSVTLVRSTISGNTVTDDNGAGGGVFADSNLTATDSTISGNSALGDFSAGGGAFVVDDATFIRSTVSGNTSEGEEAEGGGLFSQGPIQIENSTFSGNTVTGLNAKGGAIASDSSVFLVELIGATLTGNAATGANGAGGAVFSRAGDVSLVNSLVVGNFATGGSGNVSGTISTSDQSISNGDAALVFAQTALISGTTTAAGVLADNGGPTETVALKADGLAVNKGATAATADQRGVARAGPADLGAFEVNGAPIFTSSAAIVTVENIAFLGDVEATDPEAQPVTYAIASGVDAALFTLNATTGALAFLAAPDFEAPADAGGDNTYDLEVSASDGFNTATQAISVTVGDATEGPTEGDDRISGTAGADTIDALGGNDTVKSFADDDEITLGSGNDVVLSGTGNDTVLGGAGNDTIKSGAGDDSIEGGDGNDVILSGNDDDIIFGGDGDDVIKPGRGDDRIDGGDGDDIVVGFRGDELLVGGEGDDTLLGNLGDDTIIGGAGNDRLQGGPGRDVFTFNDANWGDDRIVLDFLPQSDTLDFTGSGLTRADLTITSAPGGNVLIEAGDSSIVINSARFGDLSGADFAGDVLLFG